jgi:hypothetical protein
MNHWISYTLASYSINAMIKKNNDNPWNNTKNVTLIPKATLPNYHGPKRSTKWYPKSTIGNTTWKYKRSLTALVPNSTW